MNHIKVLFFASARTAAGCAETQLPCHEGMDEDGFWTLLLAAHPSLAPHRGATRLALNCEYPGSGARFRPGDEVALIPPVSGG